MWRLKSHVIWLEEGDRNTNFFHKFASHMKVVNTIWELDGLGGSKLRTSKELLIARESYFEGLFKEPT